MSRVDHSPTAWPNTSGVPTDATTVTHDGRRDFCPELAAMTGRIGLDNEPMFPCDLLFYNFALPGHLKHAVEMSNWLEAIQRVQPRDSAFAAGSEAWPVSIPTIQL
jgi:hypothetical protein